ncbi:1-phosphatidylinositol phosphodiesterase-like [Stylonychia lemnae]|uniref:1-phosphatidylinositol phosphodiesterase-like n=1 Tax=Stylonychia lemnae TaxID=5949 RepID=A0A078AH80_STYLE|nr:1-phosphatidylinositol phosphodiesterase-like [Stylonychia lemnae]|eukprot:CDW80198.1 1-phosphatidylinositol phosphodiesterase-like [Stylonychia lemnae]
MLHLAMVCLTISTVAGGDVFYSKSSTPKPYIKKYSDWMGYILPSTPITNLSIPGTHDTCAKTGGAAFQCQSWTLKDQLEAGIRFLDIRARHINNGLAIHHGSVYLGTDFDTVLSTVTSFLRVQIRETVLMRVKKEHTEQGCTRAYYQTVEAKLAAFNSFIYRGSSSMDYLTLGDARGKIVILYDEWSSSTVGYPYFGMAIADDYAVYETWLSKENKKKSVSDNIMGAILMTKPIINGYEYPETKWRCTFLSGSTGVSPEMWGKKFNEQIQFYRGRLGIVVFDFPGEDAIEHVISQNFIFQSGQANSPEWRTLWGGLWGDLKAEVTTRDGEFACGARMRVEAKGKSDDTAANGLELVTCKRDKWDTQSSLMVEKGNWGDWYTKMCPRGQFIVGGQVRFQDAQIDGSDTALNGLKISCKSPQGGEPAFQEVHAGYWGEWKAAYISKTKYVCGARARFEGNQLAGDDTALNGITFKYCSLY